MPRLPGRLRSMRKNFLMGLAVLLPTILTVLLVQYIFRITDTWVVNPLYKTLPFDVDKRVYVVTIKFVILIFVFFTIVFIGLGTQIFIVRNFFKGVEELVVQRVPMVNRIYGTIKEIMSAFVGQQRELFRSAVLIEYPRKGLYSIAFITRTNHPALEQSLNKSVVSVFLPTTPNPTSGLLLFIPKDEIIELPYSVEEAIKLVVSGGALSHAAIKKEIKERDKGN